MFRGDHPDLRRVIGRAQRLALDLGHPRVGSEHLLLALSTEKPFDRLLDRAAIEDAVRRAAPDGAGAAADRATLAPLGVTVELPPGVLDRAPAGESRGTRRSRRRCARMTPPLGLDTQAAYEASLRLALARRDRDHRPEHLALALLALDPGVAWVLGDTRPAWDFPPPHRNLLVRAERRLGRARRWRELVRRYQRTTGRAVTPATTAVGLITG